MIVARGWRDRPAGVSDAHPRPASTPPDAGERQASRAPESVRVGLAKPRRQRGEQLELLAARGGTVAIDAANAGDLLERDFDAHARRRGEVGGIRRQTVRA